MINQKFIICIKDKPELVYYKEGKILCALEDSWGSYEKQKTLKDEELMEAVNKIPDSEQMVDHLKEDGEYSPENQIQKILTQMQSLQA